MNAKDLVALGIAEEVAQQIIILHGKDIEKFKADVEKHKSEMDALKAEAEGLKNQLTEAGATIEGFKKMDIDGIKKAADDWKAQAEKAALDAQAQVAALKFEHALDSALAGAKAKNIKAVRALLQSDSLKLTDDGSLVGLKEQLEKIKAENDYLFVDDSPTPQIIAGGKSKSILSDSTVDAARKAAGLPLVAQP